MKTNSFKYTAQARLGHIDYTYRPLLDIKIGGPHKERVFKALVDSGSDITVMDQEIAELLDISSEHTDSGVVSAVGGDSKGFIAPVSVEIIGIDTVFTFKVLFIKNLSKNFEIILGQQDFFLNFNVTFKKKDNVFYLEGVYT